MTTAAEYGKIGFDMQKLEKEREGSAPSRIEGGQGVFEVIIAGGGPAGSVAALYLTAAGRRVALFERARFPRFVIGESLLPQSAGVFRELGLVEELNARFQIKRGAELMSGCGRKKSRFQFSKAIGMKEPTSWQVPRAEFDMHLLEAARARGVAAEDDTAVKNVDFSAPGEVRVTVAKGNEEREVRARWFLDCTGRGAFLGAQFGFREGYAGLKKMSVYAHFRRDPAGDNLDTEYTRLVRAPDRWFWLIPLSPEVVSVGVVMDANLFRSLRATPEEILERSIANTPGVKNSLGNASRIMDVHATGDYSYRSRRFTGDRWTLTGDAAGFIDPVFSTGVMLALEASRSAARAVDLRLKNQRAGEVALRKYEARQIRMMNIYLRIVRRWYKPELIEGLLSRDPFNFFVPAINSVLAGNVPPRMWVRLRIEMFFWLLALQRRWPIFERLPRAENYLAYQTTS